MKTQSKDLEFSNQMRRPIKLRYYGESKQQHAWVLEYLEDKDGGGVDKKIKGRS